VLEEMKLAIARHLCGDRGGADDPSSDPTRERMAKELRRLPERPPALPVVWALTHEDPFLAGWGTVIRLAHTPWQP
jgi:hypothetical protein